MKVIDLDNPVPKYLQISKWMEDQINTGRFKEGEKLPSEVELSKMCEVNRNTLRQAIAELVGKGSLEKVKGVGSFIKKQPIVELKHDMRTIASFRDYFGDASLEETTIVLEKEVVTADKEVADQLLLGKDRKVILLKRLRTGDGIPYIYEEGYLPYYLFKDISVEQASGSLYKVMTEKFNIKLSRSHQTVRALNLNEKVSTMFNLPVNSAGFFMKNITFDNNQIPVELLHSYCRGDKYVFEMELGEYILHK